MVLSILCLSVSVSANSAVVSIIRSLLSAPSGVRQPDRLVTVFEIDPVTRSRTSVHPQLFYEWQRSNSVFLDIAAYATGEDVTLRSRDAERHVTSAFVTYNLPTTLGVEGVRGRSFRPEDEHAEYGCTALISDVLWQSMFQGGDILGSVVRVNGGGCTVVGVLPKSCRFPNGTSGSLDPL